MFMYCTPYVGNNIDFISYLPTDGKLQSRIRVTVVRGTTIRKFYLLKRQYMIRYGLVARIPGSHPGGSGSIPGTGIFF